MATKTIKDLTVILPVINFDDEQMTMFKTAVDSVGGEKLLIIGSEESIAAIKDKYAELEKKKNIEFFVNTGDTSYPAQVNTAVDHITTKYFSVLEYDDKFSDIWFKNVASVMDNEPDDVFALCPLTEVVSYKHKAVIGYANEAFWASSFSEKIGYMDLNSLQDYLNFNTSGAIFNREEFISLGKLKASMKLVFWYEFLMRALYKNKRIFIIPKVGYFKTVDFEKSITSEYMKSMQPKEADWWIELAKTEYFFPNDRNKQYTE